MSNDTNIYYGAYIRIVHNLVNMKRETHRKCITCNYTSYDKKYCPTHGLPLVIQMEQVKRHQISIREQFKNEETFVHWIFANDNPIEILISNTYRHSSLFSRPREITSREYQLKRTDPNELIMDHNNEIKILEELKEKGLIESFEIHNGLVIYTEW